MNKKLINRLFIGFIILIVLLGSVLRVLTTGKQDYQVYNTVLDHLKESSFTSPKFFIYKYTLSYQEKRFAFTKIDVDRLYWDILPDKSSIVNYEKRNRSKSLLQQKHLKYKVFLLDKFNNASIYEHEIDVKKDHLWILGFSKVGFNFWKNQALVYCTSGMDYIFILEKGKGKWVIKYKRMSLDTSNFIEDWTPPSNSDKPSM